MSPPKEAFVEATDFEHAMALVSDRCERVDQLKAMIAERDATIAKRDRELAALRDRAARRGPAGARIVAMRRAG